MHGVHSIHTVLCNPRQCPDVCARENYYNGTKSVKRVGQATAQMAKATCYRIAHDLVADQWKTVPEGQMRE